MTDAARSLLNQALSLADVAPALLTLADPGTLRYHADVLTHPSQTILDAAMGLPEDERAEIAAILVDSIGDGRPEAEIDAAWLAEAKRRLGAVRSGRATLIPTEDVERELDTLVDDASASETRRAG